MLTNLHVKDMALINEAEIDFGKGLNILTGETGAGKSIILGSVVLALGGRAGADIIRSGKDSALVELSFLLTPNEIEQLKNMDFPVEDDGELVLTRRILGTKSIFRINGETITAGQLKELSGVLLNMYGQHEHQSLLKSATYVKMLDDYAGDKVLEYKLSIKEHLRELKKLEEELSAENSDSGVRNRQIELLQFEINEIEEANLKLNEDNDLEERFRFLNNARRIKEAVYEVHQITGYEDNASAGTLIGHSVGRLSGISGLDNEANSICDELKEIENLLNDFNRSLGDYEEKLEFDESEYTTIEDRLNTINRLKTKYSDSIEGILKLLEDKSDELNKLNNYESYLEELRIKTENTKRMLLAECAAVSSLRKSASKPLEEKLVEAMQALNFQDVRLKIDILSDENHVKESGYDDIEFLISLNAGEELKPMKNIASGGELSRIMLAIKSVFAEKEDVSTLIFDEIDTGISGVTAYKVAEKLRELSKNHQIICITHLPQIAAMADEHFLIEKSVEDGRAQTDIYVLDEESSINELARMLGADEITESAVNNARELKARRNPI